MARAADNLIVNGMLVPGDGASTVEGWAMRGTPVRVQSARAPGEDGTALQLTVRPNAPVTFEQSVAVEPGQTLRFSARVRSEGRVVARVGQASISYHAQGEWQQLVGLVGTGAGKSLKIALQMGSLDGKPADVLLRDVVLRPAEVPAAPHVRPRKGVTSLVQDGKAAVAIVYPSDRSIYEDLANNVAAAIAKATGVSVPVVSDREATDANYPALRPEFRGTHLILIGRLGINRALWPAYNRFLAATDGYYPGGDGYVVRTAANVYRDSYNHLVLGGSSDTGAARAVEHFIARVREVGGSDGSGNLTLPWLLKVELGGDCKKAFDDRDALWTANPLDPVLPKVEPGYGTVRRWYENAMGYYWSGRKNELERAQAMIEPVLKDKAYTHHYIVEFMVRSWDMVDDTDLYTDAQRAAMDALIQQNFWDFQTGPDMRWMTVFSPPYNDVALVNRHQISPWTSDLYLAEFVRDYLEPTGDLAAVASFRAREKNAFMHHLVTERWEPTPPGGELVETLEETATASFRYALDHEEYAFFASDHARRSLHLPKIDHRTGRFMRPAGPVDSHLLLGVLASYHQDGRYLTLLDKLPVVEHPLGPFQGRYVNGVHRYTPGEELKPEPVDTFTGVQVPPISPHAKSHLREYEGGLFKLPKVGPDEVFDFVAFRSGFDADDDYLAVNGVNASVNPGVILNYSSRGVSWLNQGSSAPSEQYFDLNAVHVLRTDRWQSEDTGYPAVARRQWIASFDHPVTTGETSTNTQAASPSGGVAFSLEPYMDTRWDRQVLWVQSGLFVVRDQVTALNRGDYQVAATWWPSGVPAWRGGVWTSRSGGSELRITPLSQTFVTRQNVDDYLAGRADEPSLRHLASATLDAGQSVGIAAVLQALRPGKEPVYTASQPEAGTLVLTPDGSGSNPIVVAWGPRESGDLETDAAVIILDRERVRLINGSRLRIDGHVIVNESEPGHVSLPLEGVMRRSVTDYLQRATAAALRAADEPGAPPTQALMAEDATDLWQTGWVYEGLLRPGLVRDVRKVADDVADLGRTVELDEVRARGGGRVWNPAALPQPIWVAEAGPDGAMPPLDSDAWQQLTAEPQWRPGVKTANYGGATPVDQDVQFIKAGGIKARYVRATGAADLVYYDRLTPEARRSLCLEVAEIDNDGSASIFVKPDLWPKFIRSRWDQDDAVALLDAAGRERLQVESSTDFQSARLLDYLGNGRRQVVLVNVNGKIDIVTPDGLAVRSLNLYEMLKRFDETEGRPNTRHPAGGLPMPYSVGTWWRGSDGIASLIVSRYGSLTFIDPQGNFQGVLMSGGYVTPSMLDDGVDFNGDGSKEQLVLARGNLLQVGGDATPYVTEPKGTFFYPQIYSVKPLKELAWSSAIDGSRPLVMEAFEWTNSERTVLVARDNYLGVYDGKLNQWAFGWVPLTRLNSVARVESTGNKLTLLASTADGLLWRLSWSSTLNDKPRFSVEALADPVKRIAAPPERDGSAVMVGREGVYITKQPGRLQLIARGSFSDAQFLPGIAAGQPVVVAVTADGKVVRLDPQP